MGENVAFDATTFFAFVVLLGIVSEYMKGDKDARAWYLGMLVSTLMIIWAAWTQAYALIPLSVLRIAVYYRNHKRWCAEDQQNGIKECP